MTQRGYATLKKDFLNLLRPASAEGDGFSGLDELPVVFSAAGALK
jgi:hypothetical protein